MHNYKYPILAKPSGITLEQHRHDVMSEGALSLKLMPCAIEKYERKTGKKLSRRLNLVCKHHDDGKKSEKWQAACQKDYEAFLKWKATNNGTFKSYAKCCPDEIGKNIKSAGIRHEFQSLMINLEKKMPMVLQAAIVAHHGKLGYSNEQRWEKEGLANIWKEFQRESNNRRENLKLEQIAAIQYEFSGPRGLLQLADHRASAKEDGDFVPNLKPFEYHFPYTSKRGVQKLVEDNWEDNLLLIRAPTGAGKTDASLLWASLQINNRRADRLVIAMPTRFTSNALSINVTESLSNTGLYHSSAWFNKFQTKIDNGKIEKQKAEKIHEFARLLETPVTICTIDHLLLSLTLTREDQQLITFNLANSCLVIDEADFYDEFTQSNILVLLEILRYWNVPVLLMSASLPESVLSDYQKIGYNVKKILEDKSDNSRNRFEIKEILKYEDIDDIEDLLYLMIEKGNGIIYVNTIDKAMSYYKWFEKYNEKTEKKIKVILYHSRFVEPDKEKKENEIICILGKEVWEKGTAHGIAIMTQIGEMSINISTEIMISEICPIDRLTQRAGRMCRFDKTKLGELYVLIPQKNGTLYPAPYGTFDLNTKGWISCEALIQTIRIIEKKKYNAETLVLLLNQVYNSDRNYSVKSITNANNLKDYFMDNWLINSMQKSAIDDDSVNFWKSRDIMAQDIVFVRNPDCKFFVNYVEFQNWKIYNSIELPLYVIEKGRTKCKIDIQQISIKDEVANIYIVREGFYNSEIGIFFNEENLFLDN